MKNWINTKKIKDKNKYLLDNDKYSFLNHSFQNSEINNKLKLKYSFIENYNLFNLKNNIILKINQIQNNQRITNNKLSYLINILFSKLIGNKKYKLFHNHFSILQNKKYSNIKKEKQINNSQGRTKTEINHREKINITNKNIIKKQKNENFALASEIEVKRYNLSNQKTKSKENIFKLDNSDNNKNNKNNKNEYEELYNNSNSNLFRINNNNNNYNNLTKNSSTDNLNNSKKIFCISNNRKPITFNEISTNNLNNQNKYYLNNNDNKNIIIYNNNKKNDYNKSYTNDSKYIQHQMSNNSNNNSINKEKDFNKFNNSDNKLNKGPVIIKLNPIEKPILLMNFKENIDKNYEKNKIIKNNNMGNNIINISNSQLNERKRSNNNSKNENERISLKVGDSTNILNNINENSYDDMHSLRGKRKFSESKSEADRNYSNLSDAKNGQGFSKKIRGFNFRNNITFNQKPNSSKISQDNYNKIKGGSVRYSNNNGLFAQINSIENE